MTKLRMVKDSFWTDPYIEQLSPVERLLFLYLITNPLCNVLGIYEVRVRRISYDSGVEEKMVEKILDKFVKDKKIIRTDDWIIIVNFAKNQSQNPSIIKGMQRILDSLPNSVQQAVAGSPHLVTYLTLLNLTLLNLSDSVKNDAKVKKTTTRTRTTTKATESSGSSESSKPFDLAGEIKKLEDSARRDLQIIGFYFSERRVKFENQEQFNVALKRHLRPAGQLKHFSDRQITSAAEKAAKTTPEWTLETLVKVLTK